MDAVQDVQSYLTAQGFIDGSSGWTSVRGPLYDGTDRLVSIQADGGDAPEIYRATGIGSAAFVDPGVQVVIRGAQYEQDVARAKTEAIRTALHGLIATTLGSTEYLRVIALTSGPIAVGMDENGRPQFSIAFRLAALASA